MSAGGDGMTHSARSTDKAQRVRNGPAAPARYDGFDKMPLYGK